MRIQPYLNSYPLFTNAALVMLGSSRSFAVSSLMTFPSIGFGNFFKNILTTLTLKSLFLRCDGSSKPRSVAVRSAFRRRSWLNSRFGTSYPVMRSKSKNRSGRSDSASAHGSTKPCSGHLCFLNLELQVLQAKIQFDHS